MGAKRPLPSVGFRTRTVAFPPSLARQISSDGVQAYPTLTANGKPSPGNAKGKTVASSAWCSSIQWVIPIPTITYPPRFKDT